MSTRLVRLLASCIAILAIVAVTFMPTLTQAMANGAAVCSAATPGSPAPVDGHHVLDHCPYCALHADLAPPPPPPRAQAAFVAAWRELPAAFLAAPRKCGVWVTSQPRAPPTLA